MKEHAPRTRALARAVAMGLTAALALGAVASFADTIVYQSGKAVIGPVHAPENPQYPPYPQPSVVPVMPQPYCPAPTDEPEQSLTLYVNGRRVDRPLYFQGRTLLLPVRVIARSGGWNYSYKSGTATLTRGDDRIAISVWEKSYRKNGATRALAGYSELIGDALYAPWQFFVNALGMKVKIGDTYVKVTANASSSTSSTYTLKVNGHTSPHAPYYRGKTLMLPLRFTVESLGYSYYIDPVERRAVFSAKGIDSFIYWEQNCYPVDNRYVSLERAPEVKNGVIFVPSSFVSQALKCAVKVSGSKVTVTR